MADREIRKVLTHVAVNPGGINVVILDDGSAYGLGRQEDLPGGALVWKWLPPVPGTAAAMAAGETADTKYERYR